MKNVFALMSFLTLFFNLFLVLPVIAEDDKDAEMKKKGVEIMKKKSEAYMANDQMSTVTLHLFTKEGDEKQIKTKRYWKNFAGKDGM
ncbi:MAG: hypothetical protein HYR80_10820, partial [Nitrospirae bacterium]|nr:hypothetical protein [Nitrospirota bacterium]